MTIKEFALMCGCTKETLRYYDSIGLLKPVKIDYYTRYRYYDENQALDYVKIKNLQEASFTIDEIKELLTKSDKEIYDAFTHKLKEEMQKLQRIKEIQMSYNKEIENMKTKISDIKKQIKEDSVKFDPVVEFGLSNEEYDEIISSSLKMMDDVTNGLDFDFSGFKDEAKENYNPLNDINYVTTLEIHDFIHFKEVLDKINSLDGDYSLYFELKDDSNNFALGNILLNVLLKKNEGKKLSLSFNATESKDDKNHFYLLKRR